MNWTALIIPAFFLFVFLEFWLAKRKQISHTISFDNSISNISIGIAERLLNLLITGSFYGLYQYLFTHFAIFTIPNHWLTWCILLLATDFVWYWYHRFGHEINVMWGAHVVHHQSEEYNYTVSARITTIQAIVRNLFWCLLPLAGFQPEMVIAILVVHGTYSFFTHTETIGKLGWIEYIMVTPSHHRVHHASNEQYLNKNYGDIFIFWDKLFGTFAKEEEKPIYGLTHPLKSHSFIWQHFHYYAELIETCRRKPSLISIWKTLFGKPEIIDPEIRPYLESKFLSQKKRTNRSTPFRLYLIIQIGAALLGLFYFTLLFAEFDWAESFLVISLILITLINCGALLEQQEWIFYLEIGRASFLCFFASYEANSISLLIALLPFLVYLSLSDTISSWYRDLFLPSR